MKLFAWTTSLSGTCRFALGTLVAAVGPSIWPDSEATMAAWPSRPAASEEWTWPLQPVPRVAATFDPPTAPWDAGNRGVDLEGSIGQQVRAIGSGQVVFAGVIAGRGVVVVGHGELRSTYEPVTATLEVGADVTAGQVIGLLQGVQSHCTPNVCLHLGVRRDEVYLDPLAFLGALPVRLKPIG